MRTFLAEPELPRSAEPICNIWRGHLGNRPGGNFPGVSEKLELFPSEGDHTGDVDCFLQILYFEKLPEGFLT